MSRVVRVWIEHLLSELKSSGDLPSRACERTFRRSQHFRIGHSSSSGLTLIEHLLIGESRPNDPTCSSTLLEER